MAGGTKGRITAALIMVPATADCSLVAGFGACAEKCLIAVCAMEFETAAVRAIAICGSPLVNQEISRVAPADTNCASQGRGRGQVRSNKPRVAVEMAVPCPVSREGSVCIQLEDIRSALRPMSSRAQLHLRGFKYSKLIHSVAVTLRMP